MDLRSIQLMVGEGGGVKNTLSRFVLQDWTDDKHRPDEPLGSFADLCSYGYSYAPVKTSWNCSRCHSIIQLLHDLVSANQT